NMDSLREGIGLRGYGQRDPKKEYKREGFDLFMQMMQSVKSPLVSHMFRVVRRPEEDLQRQEEQRRRQVEEGQAAARASHPDGQAAAQAQAAGAAAGARMARQGR